MCMLLGLPAGFHNAGMELGRTEPWGFKVLHASETHGFLGCCNCLGYCGMVQSARIMATLNFPEVVPIGTGLRGSHALQGILCFALGVISGRLRLGLLGLGVGGRSILYVRILLMQGLSLFADVPMGLLYALKGEILGFLGSRKVSKVPAVTRLMLSYMVLYGILLVIQAVHLLTDTTL